MPPAWIPPGVKTSCKLRATESDLSVKFDPLIASPVQIYTFVQFTVTVCLSLYLLLNAGNYSYLFKLGAVLILTYSFCAHGFWLEGRATARWHETARLCLLLVAVQISLPGNLLQMGVSLYSVISLFGLWIYVANKAQPLSLAHH